MGNSPLRNAPVSAAVGCKPYACSSRYGEHFLKQEKYASDVEEKSIRTSPLEVLKITSTLEKDFEHLIVEELGLSLSEVVHVHDILEPQCVSIPALDQEENHSHQETECLLLNTDPLYALSDPALDQEENSNHQKTEHLRLGTHTLCAPSEEAIVLCSSMVPVPVNMVEELSCDAMENDQISVGTPASVPSLPATKLISALKGSREKRGQDTNTKLTVKWAPDVRDPPITSSSRTLKGQRSHHGHKTKKDYHTHKHMKGKSSRGSGRKHSHRKSSLIDPRFLRLQAIGGSNNQKLNSCGETSVNKQELNSCGGITVESSDYAAWRSPEHIIRGKSCYIEPLTAVTLSVGEAS